MRRAAVLLSAIVFFSCTVSYDTTSGDQRGRAAAAFGDVESDSRHDIDVSIDLKERPTVVSGMTRVGVVFVIEIANRSKEPVKLTRVQLQSVAEEAELAPLTGRKFNRVIPVGEKAKVELGAFFDIESDSPLPIEGPMTVRATLFLQDTAGSERQEYFTRRMGTVGVGVTSRP